MGSQLTPAEVAGLVRAVADLWRTPWVVVVDGTRGVAYDRSEPPERVGSPSNEVFAFELAPGHGVEVRAVAGEAHALWEWNGGDPRPPYDVGTIVHRDPRVDGVDADVRAWWLERRAAQDRFDVAGGPVDAAIRALWRAATGTEFPDEEAAALAHLSSAIVERRLPTAGRTLGEIYADLEPRQWFAPPRRDFRLPDDFDIPS